MYTHAMARPATGQTPTRGIRVPTDLWDAAKAKAAAEGRTVTEVIVSFLRWYVAGPPGPDDRPPKS
jgi:hypothetical protein